jgi:predicted MFS family arabinose efflux permease
MFDLLFAKTFLLVGGMLIITTIFSRINKAYETTEEAIINIAGTFIVLFLIMFFNESFPLNIILVGVFSGFIGWSIGPTISTLGRSFKKNKYFKSRGIKSKSVIKKNLLVGTR